MAETKTIWAFDLGKGAIGEAVRRDVGKWQNDKATWGTVMATKEHREHRIFNREPHELNVRGN